MKNGIFLLNLSCEAVDWSIFLSGRPTFPRRSGLSIGLFFHKWIISFLSLHKTGKKIISDLLCVIHVWMLVTQWRTYKKTLSRYNPSSPFSVFLESSLLLFFHPTPLPQKDTWSLILKYTMEVHRPPWSETEEWWDGEEEEEEISFPCLGHINEDGRHRNSIPAGSNYTRKMSRIIDHEGPLLFSAPLGNVTSLSDVTGWNL